MRYFLNTNGEYELESFENLLLFLGMTFISPQRLLAVSPHDCISPHNC